MKINFTACRNSYSRRKEGGKFGFAESIPDQRITALKMDPAPVDTSDVEEKAEEILSQAEPPTETEYTPVVRTPGTAQIGEGLESSWQDVEESEEDEEEDEGGNEDIPSKGSKDIEMDATVSEKPARFVELIELSESEEDEVIILTPEGAGKKPWAGLQPTHLGNTSAKNKTNQNKQKKPAN